MYGHLMAIGVGKPSRVVPFGRRTALVEVSPAPAASEASASTLGASPMFGVAMLKIAMELKKADPRPLEELIGGVLSRMNLDEREFRSFLGANGGLLKAIAQRRRY
jgi:hypothetical protein